MVSATHVIMTVHPVLVLLPVMGLLVLPYAPMRLVNGFRIVSRVTVEKQENCSLSLCPRGEFCSKAIYSSQSVCFLISCPNNTQNLSCENVTNFNDLLAEPDVNINDSIHLGKNQTGESVLSSDTNSSQSSPDGSSPNVTTKADDLISSTSTTTNPATLSNNSITIAATNLQTTPTEIVTTKIAMPKPPITTSLTTPAVTSTTTTTPKPTTTSPKPSPTTTSTTTTSTTVAQAIISKPPPSPSPSGNKTSASITPSVPTTTSSTPSAKPVQTSPASSDEKKPSPTTPKTSLSPLGVTSTLPKDTPKGDRAVIEMAGDPLTSHLLNTSSLLAVLLFGLLFFVVTVALFLKQAYESYRRKEYTQVDYLINGMYSDSGV
ncbi:uncharacterized protein PB18E9.04c-like [Sinocyclocheilus grahami]|uniref:uncharacterized protein PB18E9.04c-like n=1 Tax=Sinocyclocheilus grahami TaxID=75366 RepID=UPI0007ACBB05|nr:PREDICTED: uncharacterized protein PB18E9.04c-like [Sinocyclocheilus grahami]